MRLSLMVYCKLVITLTMVSCMTFMSLNFILIFKKVMSVYVEKIQGRGWAALRCQKMFC